LASRLPYGLEGIVRNRIEQAGVTLLAVERSLDLRMVVQGPKDLVDGFVLALSETGQVRIVWAEACTRSHEWVARSNLNASAKGISFR